MSIKMNVVYIYGLYDPITNELKYIGRTNNLENRLRDHITASRGKKGQGYRYNPTKEKWIRGLLSNGLNPVIRVLDTCTEDNWGERERLWIKNSREQGIKLTNITEGGEGFGAGPSHLLFGIKLTEEHKKKCSESLRGRKHSEETKLKIGLGNKGKIITPEQREKISKNHAIMRGQNNPFYGKHHSEETKNKISMAKKGTPSYNKGKHLSEETKIKIGDANRKSHSKHILSKYVGEFLF